MAPAFRLAGRAERVEPLGAGLINRTFRVTACGRAGGPRRYVVQALNTRVFPRPDLLMENLRRVTGHLAEKGRRTLELVPAADGRHFWVDPHGRWWRAFEHVEHSLTLSRVPSPTIAGAAGAAFGRFLRDLHDLPGPPLHAVIPGFHDTPARLRALLAAAQTDPHGRCAEARPELERIRTRAALAEVLEASGTAARRPVHNDTKVDNLLFDRDTGEVLCVIDLDTVMPGLALHDFGDMVRSGAASSTEGGAAAVLRIELYRAMLQGWVGAVGHLLSAAEGALLAIAPRVITLELAMRFLTDHLEGDAYFHTRRAGENLVRCRGQLDLLESMEARAEAMERLARDALSGAGT